MKTTNVIVNLNQGADFDVVFIVPGDNGPLNLTGYSFAGEMSSDTNPSSPATPFVFNILDQTVTDNVGKVQWSLSSEVTTALFSSISYAEQQYRLVTPYLFDVRMTDSLGVIYRLIQGKVLLIPQTKKVSP
jgi:hypothetical protein